MHGTRAQYASCLFLDGSERFAKLENMEIKTISDYDDFYKVKLEIKFEDSNAPSRHRIVILEETEWRCDLLWAALNPKVEII